MTSSVKYRSTEKTIPEANTVSTVFDNTTREAGPRHEARSAALDLDQALLLMAPEITEWLETNTQRLQDALVLYLDAGGKPPRTLMHLVKNLRGQIGSIGFPLASRVAATLFRLLQAEKPAPADVIVAHVDAIRAIIIENARGTDNPLARALVEALEEFGDLWASPLSGNKSESSLSL